MAYPKLEVIIIISADELIRLYHTEKMSIRHIAKKVNLSTSYVRKKLHAESYVRSQVEGSILRSTPDYREKISQTKIGEKNHRSRLTETQVKEIREAYKEAMKIGLPKTETQYILAEEYNVKRPTISDIVLRKTWKHI